MKNTNLMHMQAALFSNISIETMHAAHLVGMNKQNGGKFQLKYEIIILLHKCRVLGRIVIDYLLFSELS